MSFRRFTVVVNTTGSDGAATGSGTVSLAETGGIAKLHALKVVTPSGHHANADLTITDALGRTLYSLTDGIAAATKWIRLKVVGQDAAGADLATGTDNQLVQEIVVGPITVALTDTNALSPAVTVDVLVEY